MDSPAQPRSCVRALWTGPPRDHARSGCTIEAHAATDSHRDWRVSSGAAHFSEYFVSIEEPGLLEDNRLRLSLAYRNPAGDRWTCKVVYLQRSLLFARHLGDRGEAFAGGAN